MYVYVSSYAEGHVLLEEHLLLLVFCTNALSILVCNESISQCR